MKTWLAGSLALVSSAAAAAGGGTVGDIVERHDNNRWWLRHIVVHTPSILPPASASTVSPDVETAIAEYDRVMALTSDAPTRAEAIRRGAYLRVRAAEADPVTPHAQQALQRAIALYRQLLADTPDDAGNDRAHYQLARAYELLGDPDRAAGELALLTERFPDSPLAADAHFRAGELLYLAKDYAAAEPHYRAVVGRNDTAPYRQFAVYKYGWSLYQQGKFEDALAPFLSILSAELPANVPEDAASALGQIAPNRADLVADAVHVISMAFASLGERDAIHDYFARRGGEPRYSAMLHLAVGAMQEKLQRYSDAAGTYAAYVAHHPADASAAAFEQRVIDAYALGNFTAKALEAKAAYVEHFGFDAPAWKSSPPPASVARALRTNLQDLAASAHADKQFAKAADAYRRLLAWFPDDASAPDLNLLYADALLDSGDAAAAAQQYLHTAYDYPRNAKSAEAAFAAVQAQQARADGATGDARAAALRDAIAAGIRLADAFPQHPQRAAVLAASALDTAALADWDQAIALAQRALGAGATLPSALQLRMLGVIADGHFARNRFPDAERAYANLLSAMDARDAQRQPAVERLAASIYRAAEVARGAGDLRAAANAFQRVSSAAPTASIRPTADYDAAAALIALRDWPAARAQLETFRVRYPGHALVVDVDKKLAVVAQNDHRPMESADAYARVARAASEPVDMRAQAALLAAQRYEEAGARAQSGPAYEFYLASFDVAPEQRVDVLRKLADLAGADTPGYRRRLDQIIAADAAAGSQRTDRTRALAARATLEIGRMQAQAARQIALTQPLARSLAQRKSATDSAVATLLSAANAGLADVTPAAGYEIGRLYADLADALLRSERPRHLTALALDQYNVLLEEQSDPFVQKAIAAYEANLGRLRENVWGDAISASAAQLAALVPGRYGKREINEASDDSLR